MTSLNVIWISVHMHVYTYQKDKPHTHAASHPIVCMKGGNKIKKKKKKLYIMKKSMDILQLKLPQHQTNGHSLGIALKVLTECQNLTQHPTSRLLS